MNKWFMSWCDAEISHLRSMVASEVAEEHFGNAAHYKSKIAGVERARDSYGIELDRQKASPAPAASEAELPDGWETCGNGDGSALRTTGGGLTKVVSASGDHIRASFAGVSVEIPISVVQAVIARNAKGGGE